LADRSDCGKEEEEVEKINKTEFRLSRKELTEAVCDWLKKQGYPLNPETAWIDSKESTGADDRCLLSISVTMIMTEIPGPTGAKIEGEKCTP